MIPKCCQTCTRVIDRNGCSYFRNCHKYALWFSKTWAHIQIAAQKLKEEKAKENIKK